MYAIHLPRSSLFCKQPSVGTKRGAERCDGNGPGHYEAGSARGMACVYAIPPKMGVGALCPCLSIAPFFLTRSFLGMQAGALQLSWNTYGKARPLRSRPAQQRPARQDTQGHPRAVSSGRQPSRYAGQSPWQPRVLSFRPSPEKNRPGRPCGAWLPRKKTL